MDVSSFLAKSHLNVGFIFSSASKSGMCFFVGCCCCCCCCEYFCCMYIPMAHYNPDAQTKFSNINLNIKKWFVLKVNEAFRFGNICWLHGCHCQTVGWRREENKFIKMKFIAKNNLQNIHRGMSYYIENWKKNPTPLRHHSVDIKGFV